MYECPTCHRTLSTKRGMRQHHTKVHGESLPNRTCKGCEREFYDPKADRLFCDDCNPYAGEHNGNWKNAKETASCKLCEAAFEYYSSDKEGVYCPQCVADSDRFLGTPSYELREVERVTKECEQCRTELTFLKSRVEYGYGRFCSRRCHHKWMADDWEGAERPYVSPWWRVRAEALERDEHRCQVCGVTREVSGVEPDIHHIKPVREFSESQNAHTLKNVIALCRTCHRHAEIDNIPRTFLLKLIR